jgi:hypothetical protein
MSPWTCESQLTGIGDLGDLGRVEAIPTLGLVGVGEGDNCLWLKMLVRDVDDGDRTYFDEVDECITNTGHS